MNWFAGGNHVQVTREVSQDQCYYSVTAQHLWILGRTHSGWCPFAQAVPESCDPKPYLLLSFS